MDREEKLKEISEAKQQVDQAGCHIQNILQDLERMEQELL